MASANITHKNLQAELRDCIVLGCSSPDIRDCYLDCAFANETFVLLLLLIMLRSKRRMPFVGFIFLFFKTLFRFFELFGLCISLPVLGELSGSSFLAILLMASSVVECFLLIEVVAFLSSTISNGIALKQSSNARIALKQSSNAKSDLTRIQIKTFYLCQTMFGA